MINVRISVRNLIEFILREGDIDNRFGTFSEDAMAEGARIHRMLQKRAGSDYSPEVELSYSYVEDDVEISVEGRADGIIRNVNGVTVDEIKTSYADIMQYKESKPLHLAQAKFYAYMIAEKGDLPVVNVRLSYVNIDTEEIKYFNYTFLKEELLSFTSGVLKEYVKWARLEASLKEERNKSIKGLPFPFEYRKGQDELVRQVYYTIYHKKKLFLQAPTGVGKTISTMYPAIQAL
ncbi:MAG: PD-(D/E)XK nuclease family protein, partial [Lachnospiraceae bacterium]|nr:PD-(D/E)XK nuclease family protein [Lachnospiraceae bacterium]